ncbi:hypothetical protein [Larkinella punicea]|uniref:T9SS C-terminal target domain-containing protein n=1 Tax=Larkinella punicea TaxID=2315727 RepID=A0A368JRN5_9BACT|nr:hypothetical protein [Larkinella punicea]RCR70132.1 hypothetical protein DUE52_07140 [Larkinella punicea]
MNRIIVLILLFSGFFMGRKSNAQVVIDASTNIFLITENAGDPTIFAGPNHTGVLTVNFQNLSAPSIPIGAIRVVVTLNSFVNYVSLQPNTYFTVESSSGTSVSLVNTLAAIPTGAVAIDLNTIAVAQTAGNVILQADIEVANALLIQENTPGNNASNVQTSVGSSALPVTLSSFNVKAVNQHAVLEWTTSSEKNNAFFEVQHSTNARDFEVLGKVNGHGTTYQTQNYRFTQEYPDPSVVHYYRLRQVDTDGKYEFSFLRSLTFEGYVGIELKLSTNPVTNGTIKAYVDYGDENLSREANLVLVDNMGRTVGKQSILLEKGRNTVQFQGVSLHSGLYVISLQNPSLVQPKFVKVAVQ